MTKITVKGSGEPSKIASETAAERVCSESRRPKFLAPGIKRLVIEAPRVARKQDPGQFVIVRIGEKGEPIPLTIESSDAAVGTTSTAAQVVGQTTHMLHGWKAGDWLSHEVGTLGKPSEISRFGTVVVVGGGVGAAMAYPTAAELKLAGNDAMQRRRREGNELKLVNGLRAAGNRIPGAVCRG